MLPTPENVLYLKMAKLKCIYQAFDPQHVYEQGLKLVMVPEKAYLAGLLCMCVGGLFCFSLGFFVVVGRLCDCYLVQQRSGLLGKSLLKQNCSGVIQIIF